MPSAEKRVPLSIGATENRIAPSRQGAKCNVGPTKLTDREPSSRGAAESIEEVVELILERIRGGERPDIDSWIERHPHLADEIRAVVPMLLVMEEGTADEKLGNGGETAAAENRGQSSASIPDQLGEYRIIEELGRGGMGIVFRAEQSTLSRIVALKVLPYHALFDDRSLRRFHLEARAAAGLEHANIVGVYGFGEEEGVHYYVMQLVEGQSLDRVLADVIQIREGGKSNPHEATTATTLHRAAEGPAKAAAPNTASAASTTASSTTATGRHWSDEVARIGASVADALQYAHGRGVLHRDIKPANVLIDARGHTWVTDFGLAKVEGGDELTRSGEILGTLRYMAPESLRGWNDARSDVYCLGVTLYECLTLQPAFHDVDRARLARKIVEDEPAPPRRLVASIPRDLETIVLKAMAKEPSQRYATAGLLAEDLRRYLVHEPISARRSTTLERGIKWARRKPAQAALVCVLLLSIVAALAGALWHNRQLADQVETTRLAREQSEADYRRAKRTVENMLSRFGLETLRDRPGKQSLQRQVLEEALVFWEEVIEERSNTETHLELAKALYAVAHIRQIFGEHERGKLAARRALAELDLCDEQAGEASLLSRDLRTTCLRTLGRTLLALGDKEAGLEVSSQSRALLETLVTEEPTLLEARLRLIRWISEDAELQVNETPETTRRDIEAAIARLDRLRVESSQSESKESVSQELEKTFALSRARLLGQLGRASYELRELRSAEESLLEAESLIRDLIAREPADRSLWTKLAHSLDRLGVVYASRGRLDEASAKFTEAVPLLEELRRDFPESPVHLTSLSNAYEVLGYIANRRRQPDSALDHIERAVEVQEELVRLQPDLPGTHRELSKRVRNLGVLFAQRVLGGEDTLAEKADRTLVRSAEVADEVTRRTPGDSQALTAAAAAWSTLGAFRRAREETEQAIPALERAAELGELAVAATSVMAPRKTLYSCLNDLAAARARSGDIAGARAAREEARSHLEALLGDRSLRGEVVKEECAAVRESAAHASAAADCATALAEARELRDLLPDESAAKATVEAIEADCLEPPPPEATTQ